MFLSLDKTTNQLTISLNDTGRTKSQQYIVAAMVKENRLKDLIAYIESFKGHHNYISLNRLDSKGTDKLANKGRHSILELYERLCDVDARHVPYNEKQSWIGVEIECCIPFSAVDMYEGEQECSRCDGTGHDEFTEDGDPIEGSECHRCNGACIVPYRPDADDARRNLRDLFKSNRIKLVNVKDDGSIRIPDESYFEAEITVLTQLDRPDNLKKVCDLLNRIGAKVNKSCGMHVHLDARHLSASQVKAIGRKFEHALPVLAAMVPETRRTNDYCKLSVSKLTGSRYHAINLTAFKKYRTVEVRLHSSTTDFNKIIQWAKLLQAIASADRIPTVCKDLNQLTEHVSIPEDLVEYISQRTALFSGEDSINTSALDQDSSDQPEQQIGA